MVREEYGGNRNSRGLDNTRKRKQRKRIYDGGEIKNKIISFFNGGLGNRIFQIYAGLGYAEKWGSEYYLSDKKMGCQDHVSNEESMKDLKTLFPNIKLLDDSENVDSWKIIEETEQFKYKSLENPNTNVIIDGYRQSYKYFPQNLPELKIPIPENNLYNNVNKEHIYFLHIRLGDYVNSGFELDLTKYYIHCINKIKGIDSQAEFFILSNELEKAKQYIQDKIPILNNYTVYYDSATNRLDSLYYMSQSKGGICSNSTFSWVGAFSIQNKNKETIFIPKPWFKHVPDDAEIYPDWATLVDTRILSGGKRRTRRIKSRRKIKITRKQQKGGDYKDTIFPDDELNCKYLSMYGIIKASKDIKNLYCINFANEASDFTIPNEPFVLFTYSDNTIPDDNMEKSTEILDSPNLLHWYAQNLTKHDNPKLSIIPIGIDYHTIAEHKSSYEWWGPKETPVQQEKLIFELLQNAKQFNQREKKLYCNFFTAINRYPNRYGAVDRKEALEQISNDLIFIEKENVPRAQSWKKMSELAFVLSPHGNGYDCHRTWEALALGCIPIVKTSPIDPLYNDLPVLIVKQWSEVNEELLDKIVRDFSNRTFNLDKITYKYWIEKIKSSFTQNGGSEEKIDIVIAYHPKDKKVLPYCIEGTKNIKNRNNIYIISSEDPKIEGTIYINENSFPFKKDNIKEYFGEKDSSRAGWYFKQLMNLYAHRVIKNITNKFLLLDCDTLFINEVSMVDNDNKTLYSTGSENHEPYFDHMNKLIPGLNRQIPEKSGIVHHLMVEKKYLDEIIQKVEEIHKKDFWKVMMELIDKNEIHSSGFAEYEIYFNYMLKYHPDVIKLRDLRWRNYNELSNTKNVKTIKELIDKYKDKYDFISLHSWQIDDNTFKNNSNTNINIPFIFVHIGETKFPEYINTSFKQVKKWNPNSELYLICSKTHESKIDKSLVNFVDIKTVEKSDKHKHFNSESKLNSKFRDGFWKFTSQRLFMLEDFCKKNSINEFFHLENDNMIYFNTEEVIEQLRKIVNGIGAPRLNNDEITFGLLYCNNLEVLNKLNEFIVANNSSNNYNANEMKLGSRFFKENPTTTYYLPSIPLIKDISQEEIKFYSNNLNEFKGIFDPAQYGQWLGGIDPDNGNSKVLSYSNPNTFIQPNLFEYKIIKESNNLSRYHIYYKDKNIDLPIYLLHVHSKKLDNFVYQGGSNDDVCLIITGLLKDTYVDEMIESYKNIRNKIVSTWNDQDTVLLEKLKNNEFIVLTNDYPNIKTSANLQSLACYNGLKKAKELNFNYAIRIRTDIIISDVNKFIEINLELMKDKLVILYCHNNNAGLYIDDYFIGGHIDKMILFYNVLQDATNTRYPEKFIQEKYMNTTNVTMEKMREFFNFSIIKMYENNISVKNLKYPERHNGNMINYFYHKINSEVLI